LQRDFGYPKWSFKARILLKCVLGAPKFCLCMKTN